MSAAGNSSGLTPEEVEEIERSFREYDTNKNGSITPDEMKECLHKAGVTALDKEVDYILKRMDKNHDGNVTHAEYVKFMSAVYRGEHEKLKRKAAQKK
ncbi:unnamed protein product [Didymodactylos carnosus]|uniref:EF-hand domain-containing protein n=1 Tax=Didymodactylos carnosus TaxID=1234261 RepID=A0A8S2JLH0_9BILA|nr:unnamed protein product [Didymodactylos carnosus]CAF3804422.1 unnamed protein product [Didymodactylos carnosus]